MLVSLCISGAGEDRERPGEVGRKRRIVAEVLRETSEAISERIIATREHDRPGIRRHNPRSSEIDESGHPHEKLTTRGMTKEVERQVRDTLAHQCVAYRGPQNLVSPFRCWARLTWFTEHTAAVISPTRETLFVEVGGDDEAGGALRESNRVVAVFIRVSEDTVHDDDGLPDRPGGAVAKQVNRNAGRRRGLKRSRLSHHHLL